MARLGDNHGLTEASMKKIAVVGAGPAGLMAAEVLSAAGFQVDVYDAMASVGRKFLLAGIGGLNLTHGEPAASFCTRYGERSAEISSCLADFGADALCSWAHGLGIETFVGSSNRVFPVDMKAAPLLRAWLHRLRHPAVGPAVRFHMRHRWLGWAAPESGNSSDGQSACSMVFEAPAGPVTVQAHAVVLALGGGSWARLGSTGAWVDLLRHSGVEIASLAPANCGFDVTNGWSTHMTEHFAGHALKSVALETTDAQGSVWRRKGEFVLTSSGLEGSLVYAASALLRQAIEREGRASLHLDLLPDWPADRVLAEVSHPRGSRSLSSHLKSRLHLEGVKSALLYERLSKDEMHNPVLLAHAIKALPISLSNTRPIDEAISSAGGVRFEAMSERLMLNALPGIFCAGEMLDWEAPTGGYLLTACMSTGVRAAQGVLAWLNPAQRSG